MKFASKLNIAMRKENITTTELAKKIIDGEEPEETKLLATKQKISAYLDARKVPNRRSDDIPKIAKALNVSEVWLAEADSRPNEKELEEALGRIDPKRREEVLELIELLLKEEN